MTENSADSPNSTRNTGLITTKVTRREPIGKPSPVTAPPPTFIDPHSPGFANTYEFGLHCEALARTHFEKLGFILIASHLPLVFAEIDLVFLSPELEIVLVEVKSVNESALIFAAPVSQKQRSRLRRALVRWQEGVEHPVRLHLAAVNHNGEVLTFFDFLQS